MQKFYRITRNAAKCKVCGMTVESKHVHDFKTCRCENQLSVDGGKCYIKRSAMNFQDIEELSTTEERDLSQEEVNKLYEEKHESWYPIDNKTNQKETV